MSDPLESLRNRIDELDRRLIEALAERQRVVTEIAGLKADPALPLQDAEREHDLLSRVSALAGAQGLDSYFVESLYRRILEHSVRFQAARQDNEGRGAGLVVAYQGVEGSYSHTAARSSIPRLSIIRGGARGGGMWRGGGGLPADREFSYRIDYGNVRSPEPDES